MGSGSSRSKIRRFGGLGGCIIEAGLRADEKSGRIDWSGCLAITGFIVVICFAALDIMCGMRFGKSFASDVFDEWHVEVLVIGTESVGRKGRMAGETMFL